jgi:hypothetical protein
MLNNYSFIFMNILCRSRLIFMFMPSCCRHVFMIIFVRYWLSMCMAVRNGNPSEAEQKTGPGLKQNKEG